MRFIYGVFLLIAHDAIAADWICQEQASQRHGNEIHACGVGAGADENAARLSAFDNSKIEFERVCKASDDCRGRSISVFPQRTSCEKKGQSFSCYRMVVFTIVESGEVKADKNGGARHSAALSKEVLLEDKQEVFTPFVYEQISHLPKITIGLTKAEVAKRFGKPASYERSYDGYLQFVYKGEMCQQDYIKFCTVRFTAAGKVESYSRFNIEYTDDLK